MQENVEVKFELDTTEIRAMLAHCENFLGHYAGRTVTDEMKGDIEHGIRCIKQASGFPGTITRAEIVAGDRVVVKL